MKIINWEPLGKIDRYFDDFSLRPLRSFGWDLAVDVFEEGESVMAKMNLPGIDPEKIEISTEGDMLHISGEREEEKEEKNKEYYSKEIRRGSFSRTVELPHVVDASKTKATYQDGVLTVTMPALKEEKKPGVTIKVTKE